MYFGKDYLCLATEGSFLFSYDALSNWMTLPVAILTLSSTCISIIVWTIILTIMTYLMDNDIDTCNKTTTFFYLAWMSSYCIVPNKYSTEYLLLLSILAV